jgi:membrane-bound lytic murein transglycosylase B
MVPSTHPFSRRAVVQSLRRWLLTLPALALATAVLAAPTASAKKAPPEPPGYSVKRPEVRSFVDEMVREEGFRRRDVTRWLEQAHFQPKIIEAMHRPYVEPPKWYEYAPRFLSADRVDTGVAFMRRNAVALQRAQDEFGVPPEIVTAIIGVETFYGRNLGSHRVIDALATLAFDYPRRATFFRGELRQFLVFAREQKISPLDPKGSFAGAVGVPQFMPGSVRRYGIDFDGDGHVDLWTSEEDAIGSVANYLARHDWQRGQPIALPALIGDAGRDTALHRIDGNLSERRPMSAWNADDVKAIAAPEDLSPEPVGLLQLEEQPSGDDSSTYWIACPNFYVITRYNKSPLYAAAVWRLSELLRLSVAMAR